MMKVLNATTGQLISHGQHGYIHSAAAVADGTLIYWNDYDAQIYAIGQGATSMTVNAPNAAVSVNQPIVISGTVTDVSAGSEQQAVKADYPNGLPVASDASMSDWMAHVYMQKAMPSNFTGVTVTVSIIDANGNYRTIGTTTTDSTGMYSISWKPDISRRLQSHRNIRRLRLILRNILNNLIRSRRSTSNNTTHSTAS